MSRFTNSFDHRVASIFACFLILFLSIPSRAAAPSGNTGPAGRTPIPAFSTMPVCFEPGPPDRPNSLQARGAGHLFLIEPASASLALRQGRSAEFKTLTFQLVGADKQARLSAEGGLPGAINYLIGDDPVKWRTQLPLHSRARAQAVYPGIDVVYYGNGPKLEYDFIVAPGANPSAIALRFQGADSIKIDKTGDLVVCAGTEVIRQPRPVIYQVFEGKRRRVSGGYHLRDSRTVDFSLAFYDRSRELVIDPMLSYSTFFGGNFGDAAYGVKVDTNGFIYLAGETLSHVFLGQAGTNSQSAFGGGRFNGDAFVAKFAPGGANLVYFTYIGGSGNEGARDLAVDDAGHVFITGFTDSTNFPVNLPGGPVFGLTNHINGQIDRRVHVYSSDAFVTELEVDGASLVYSAYLGGSLAEVGAGIALDPAGNTYVTGYTFSSNFPVVNAFQTVLGGTNDVFVSKIAPLGSALLYSTYLGGTNTDVGEGIAVDGSGNAYVTGYTSSTNFPVTANAGQSQISGSANATLSYRNKRVPADAFMLRFDTTQAGVPSLLYSSLLGGTNNDYGFRIALDADSNIYLAGTATSTNFPNVNHTTNIGVGALPHIAANSDAFLSKFHFVAPDDLALVYSILFGGSLDDTGWGVTVDPAGNAYVVGHTTSRNFPTNNTFGFLRATNTGGSDVFVTAFDTNAANVLFSAYLGGKSDDFGYGIAVDAASNVYVAGRTLSTNFPIVAPSGVTPVQTARYGTNDAFLAIIAPTNAALSLVPAGQKLAIKWPYAPEYRLETAADQGATWQPLNAKPFLTNGWNVLTIDPTGSSGLFRLSR